MGQKEEKNHYKYIDIAKGLSIILIVFGHIQLSHTSYSIWQDFIFLFHVPVFFMIAGLTVNGEKIKHTGEYIWKKVKTVYVKAMLFYLPCVWLHNWFCKIGFYNSALYGNDLKHSFYTVKDTLKQSILALLCAGREPILGAMWFVFVLFFALCGYSVLSGILGKLVKEERIYEELRTLLIWSAFVISAFLTNHYHFTIKRFSNVFAAIALIHTMYLLKKYRAVQFDSWLILLVAFIGLLQNMEYGVVQMNENIYGNPVFLLSNAVFGTYLICFAAKKIEKFRWSNLIAYCGKKSFYIMALHMAVFKIVTVVLMRVYPSTVMLGGDIPIVSKWRELFIYLIAGVLLPVAICRIVDAVKRKKTRISGVTVRDENFNKGIIDYINYNRRYRGCHFGRIFDFTWKQCQMGV